MDLSPKQKTFPQNFCPFLKSTLNYEQFQKKRTSLAYVFAKLPNPKYVVG